MSVQAKIPQNLATFPTYSKYAYVDLGKHTHAFASKYTCKLSHASPHPFVHKQQAMCSRCDYITHHAAPSTHFQAPSLVQNEGPVLFKLHRVYYLLL
jgi:hypothetical protein